MQCRVVRLGGISPSTEEYDRGGKFDDDYRFIPSLREYVLVAQDEALIEVRPRDDVGNWISRVYRAGQQARSAQLAPCSTSMPSTAKAKKNTPR